MLGGSPCFAVPPTRRFQFPPWQWVPPWIFSSQRQPSATLPIWTTMSSSHQHLKPTSSGRPRILMQSWLACRRRRPAGQPSTTRQHVIFYTENHQLQGRLLNILLHRLSQVRLRRPLCSLRLSPSSRNRENFMKRLRALISETLMEHLYVTSRDISQMSSDVLHGNLFATEA